MKKSLIWISASVATLSALASGGTNEEFNSIPVSNKADFRKTLLAARVFVNADGSAHVIDSDGNATYINPETLDMIKKINPGIPATLHGSVPCVGKSR